MNFNDRGVRFFNGPLGLGHGAVASFVFLLRVIFICRQYALQPNKFPSHTQRKGAEVATIPASSSCDERVADV